MRRDDLGHELDAPRRDRHRSAAAVSLRAAPQSAQERLLLLQRQVGNRAVAQLLATRVVQRVGGEPTGGSGRRGAVEVLQSCQEGSVGWVMLLPVQMAAGALGDVGSGRIGAHYRAILPLLRLPATRLTLRFVAMTETRWWARQQGFAGWLGRQLSWQSRFRILLWSAARQGRPIAAPDRR